MLEAVGAASLDELMAQTLPGSIRQRMPLALGAPLSSDGGRERGLSETEALAHLRGLAGHNRVVSSLIGQGYSRHPYAAGDPAQHPGKPGLVHGLHAVPGGDLARAGWKRC